MDYLLSVGRVEGGRAHYIYLLFIYQFIHYFEYNFRCDIFHKKYNSLYDWHCYYLQYKPLKPDIEAKLDPKSQFQW